MSLKFFYLIFIARLNAWYMLVSDVWLSLISFKQLISLNVGCKKNKNWKKLSLSTVISKNFVENNI